MTVFTELVNDSGLDPFAPCPVDMTYTVPVWYPRDAASMARSIAAQMGTTLTAWTSANAAELRALLDTPALPAAPERPELPMTREMPALDLVTGTLVQDVVYAYNPDADADYERAKRLVESLRNRVADESAQPMLSLVPALEERLR